MQKARTQSRMFVCPLTIIWLSLFCASTSSSSGQSRAESKLPLTNSPTLNFSNSQRPRHQLLDCKFTNELGQAVTLNDFHGQALAITFFFTRCPIPQYCPRLSRNFQEASQKLL